MSNADKCMRADQDHARAVAQRGPLARYPSRQLAVITGMDCRVQAAEMLGLVPGDAHILRHAGAIDTDDVIRSPILSSRFLGTREIFVANRTACGPLGLFADQVRKERALETGSNTSGLEFHGFRDLASNIKNHVRRIGGSPFIPPDIAMHGLIGALKAGILRQVM